MNKKLIRILSTSRLRQYGNISGPVRTAFFEDIKKISSLLAGGVHVVEVLADGSELRLDLNNFDVDHNKQPEVIKKYIPNPIDEVRNVKAEEAKTNLTRSERYVAKQAEQKSKEVEIEVI